MHPATTPTRRSSRGAPTLSPSIRSAGYYQFQGGAGHTSGWLSPVPSEWVDTLGGTWITGQSSGIPIISRTSVGPSAFAFDPAAIVDSLPNPPNSVPTTKLLDFSLANPLAADLDNSSDTNNVWTHLSRATYGVVLPGTRTYATFGHSGGHGPQGVCYKCTQDNGNLCGGYCAPDHTDYYQFLWLWDMNDLVDVMNGVTNSYDVRPYWHGAFLTPFENGTHQIGGGAYDPASGKLYLSIEKADRAQGTYANPPVIVVYEVVPAVAVGPRILLEGPYDAGGDSMRTIVRPFLPLSHPFSGDHYNGTVLDFDEPMSVAYLPVNSVGWVIVQLRTGDPLAPPMTVVATKAALLKSDGKVVGLDGSSKVGFTGITPGDYYVAVFHRNHLGVISRNPVTLNSLGSVYDFTMDSTQAFGAEAMKELEPGVWGLFTGEAAVDGSIDVSDFTEWLVTTQAVLSGYQTPDFDLNAVVDVSDFTKWLVNTKLIATSKVPSSN